MASRLHPNLVAFNHTISTCGKTSEWRVALALLGKLKRERTEAGRSADIYSYNSAIGACEKGHVWETALSLTMDCMEGRMKCMGCLERRMSFDAVTLNTALSSCGKSEKWPQAFQAFHLAKDGERERKSERARNKGAHSIKHCTKALGPCFP